MDLPAASTRTSNSLFALCTGYIVFIVYGSLIPFDFQPYPLSLAVKDFAHTPFLNLGIASRADWISNFILYIPIGLLLTAYLTSRNPSRLKTIWVLPILAVFLISLAVSIEFTQLFFKPRTVSLNDLLAEGLGGIFGIMLSLLFGKKLKQLLSNLAAGQHQAVQAFVALYLIGYIAASLFPYDFLLGVDEFAWKWKTHPPSFLYGSTACTGLLRCTSLAIYEAFALIPLGFAVSVLTIRNRQNPYLRAIIFGALLGLTLEAIQWLMASGLTQGISIATRMAGMAAGVSAYSILTSMTFARALRSGHARFAAVVLFPIYLLILMWLNWSSKGEAHSMNDALQQLYSLHWLPFYYHYYTSEQQAFGSLLNNMACYLAVGMFAWLGSGTMVLTRSVRLSGAWLGIATSLIIETGKLWLSGTHPDPTNILIGGAAGALGAVTIPWMLRLTNNRETSRTHQLKPPTRSKSNSWRNVAALFISLAFVGIIALAYLKYTGNAWHVIEMAKQTVADSLVKKIPAPNELPTPYLPNFNYKHPRLPAPTPRDAARLHAENPAYVGLQHFRVQNDRGFFEASAILEMIEPGSQDLNNLFQRLMALSFNDRGQEQTKPLAVAYDWLYDRWSEQQRGQLRSKLIEGCNYEINFIRNERLSPYNVYLYNSPLQALMACTIALHGDDPRSDSIMAFTNDYWKNRVLPVWRQVMGKNGGWHEGGEYIALGIGQAIYQLPNMWRLATGEDYFKSEPGIRGFLDFLVYRTQPDGTHLHLGDGGFFDRGVPDLLALAQEYRHASAFSLINPPKFPSPTSWPWGPLSDTSLYDPHAAEKLPLTKHFDGIGLVVMRSGWGPNATYITFKAGDNYWSHSHLDQGSFTIFKGGALAIDSGLYYSYGSDHHMNYQYQTIAHNTITVTDPSDTIPGSTRKRGEPPRSYANDGGQRRIGSGWGVEPAPLDLNDWNSKQETYHTGKIISLKEIDGVTTIVADITTAYTNASSGNGSFSSRTRRVEKLVRTFVYDRTHDTVTVTDEIEKTRPEFVTRWLLHSINQPIISGRNFLIHTDGDQRPGHAGGQLKGEVLAPGNAVITAIGGAGHEFEVDHHQYDDQGKVFEVLKERPHAEPGAWRIEIRPDDASSKTVISVKLTL